jgi:hypothetical protein
MTETNYAFIKDGNVVNIAVFHEPSEDLLNTFKEDFHLDQIVLAGNNAITGATFDGTKFWLPQPYPSWVKGADDWEAPVEYPIFDQENPKHYRWDEATLSWVEIQ